MKKAEIKAFLDEKAAQYESLDFISADPIQIPHSFTKKEDIEISGFLAATIAWGNRKSIITNAQKMMGLMDNAPHDFVLHHQEKDLKRFEGFVHRTFNDEDMSYFVRALKHIYTQHHGLEAVFAQATQKTDLQTAIHHFKQLFFSLSHPSRTQKHVSDPLKGSAAKHLNMYLRWMVRSDKKGVDFGFVEIHITRSALLPLRCSLRKCRTQIKAVKTQTKRRKGLS